MHPPVEYHLEITNPSRTHGDFASETPFPAIGVGDIVHAEGFVTGETMGIPNGVVMRVTRVEHILRYFEGGGPAFHHFTTVLYTMFEPKQQSSDSTVSLPSGSTGTTVASSTPRSL